jgi:hypothetical protein
MRAILRCMKADLERPLKSPSGRANELRMVGLWDDRTLPGELKSWFARLEGAGMAPAFLLRLWKPFSLAAPDYVLTGGGVSLVAARRWRPTLASSVAARGPFRPLVLTSDGPRPGNDRDRPWLGRGGPGNRPGPDRRTGDLRARRAMVALRFCPGTMDQAAAAARLHIIADLKKQGGQKISLFPHVHGDFSK